MPATSLSLVVIRSSRIDKVLDFYAALGLTFKQEQHGSGPLHHSCEVGSIVLEIYPGEAGTPIEPKAGGATMLGFQVDSLDDSLANLQMLGAEPKSPPKVSAWGRWVNVADPDGRIIQVTETQK